MSNTNDRTPSESSGGGAAAERTAEGSKDTLPDGLSQPSVRDSVKIEVGAVIGRRYKLISAIADGAMGQVFVAENIAIGMKVAVKLLRPELLANMDFRRRFSQEARAVAAIEHPNVARVFDLIGGHPTFIVMEFVPGKTLAQVIRDEGPLKSARAVGIAQRICWGLDAAHAAGVIHRDLKPANVILAPSRELGEVPKIVDFGLAKLAVSAETAQLTRTGQIVGTPAYMAPEQIAGREVDARTDVYAVGCVLYEMLCGQPPFPTEAGDVQVLYRQMHEAPAPASSLNPEVPPKLDEALAKALAKQPEDRFASTKELSQALSRCIERRRAGEPAKPVKPPPAVRRSVFALGLGLALVLGSIAGIALRRSGDDGAPTPAPATAAAAAASSPAGGLLVVVTEPPGASVLVDGVALAETTPTSVRPLAPGPHTVTARKAGRMEVTRQVTVAGGEDRVALHLALPQASRTLLVRTVPTGAAIYVDGETFAGPSPTTITVTDDDFHEIRAEKVGFDPLVARVTPEDRQPELSLILETSRRPRAELVIDSRDTGDILLDGVDTGADAPGALLHVTAGRHTVQLRDSSGATSKVVTVEPRAGETLRLMLNLTGK